MSKYEFCEVLCCPKDAGDLLETHNEFLKCKSCSTEYPVINGIPRLLATPYYNESWDESWDEKWVKYDGGVGYDFRMLDPKDMAYKIHDHYRNNWEKNNEFLESVSSSKIVLDIGCGIGPYALRAAQLGAPFVIALDQSIGAVETGQKVIKEKFPEFADRIMFVQANAAYLPIKNEAISLTQGLSCLHQTGDLEKCIEEAVRVTEKGGILIIWIYAKSIFERGDECRKSFANLFKSVFWNFLTVLSCAQIDFFNMIMTRLPKRIFDIALNFVASDFVFAIRKLVAKVYFRHIYCYPDKGYRLINYYGSYSRTYSEASSEVDVAEWSIKYRFKILGFTNPRLGFIARKET